MNNFTFHVTTDIRFGKDRLNELPEVLNTFGKNVLLVYGGGSHGAIDCQRQSSH